MRTSTTLAQIRRWVLITALFGLAGCAGNTVAEPGMAVTGPAPGMGQEGYANEVANPYVLRANDVIRITVFREENLSVDSVPISAEGSVSMPLIGTLTVAGLTPGEAEARMEQMMGARYLREPDVAVNVLEYASHKVTVEGAVETPGLYDFQPGTRLSGAISLAEGLTNIAREREVAIFRPTATGMQVAKFDYDALRRGTMLDPVIQPGDRVVVGTDGLSAFWQDLLRTLPAFAFFTNVNF